MDEETTEGREERRSVERIANWLDILGVLQLIGLNPAGLLWLFWSTGILERNKTFRRIVLALHGVLIALATVLILAFFFLPNLGTRISVMGAQLDRQRHAAAAVFVYSALLLLYGLPVYWLTRPKVKILFAPKRKAPRTKIQKIASFNTQFEAEAVSSILESKGVPHNIVSNADYILDGIFQPAAGWGFIESPAKYRGEIEAVIAAVRSRSRKEEPEV